MSLSSAHNITEKDRYIDLKARFKFNERPTFTEIEMNGNAKNVELIE